jgi:hypothetical protein
MQGDTLALLAALRNGVVRRVVPCKDGLFHGANDRVHDRQGSELARTTSHDVGRGY